MADEEVKKIFANVRVISVGKLAKDLGVEPAAIITRIPEWESKGLVRAVKGGGCASCAGCGTTGAPESSDDKSIEKITLVSLIKEIKTVK